MRRTALAASALASLVLAGCTSPSPASDQQGASAGTVVPALWAGLAPDGSRSSGVERATVEATTTEPAGITIDLADLDAKGAGPQWRAATGMAASLAVIFSGRNPADVDLRYTITGPIDGPSAGAILAVGTLSELRREPMSPSVTMTGTLAPDGTISIVSAVADKVRAAAGEGFTTVLIPSGTRAEPGGDDPVAVGQQLGVEVREVRDLPEAYQAFTGRELWPAAGPTNLAPRVVAVAKAAAARLVARGSCAEMPRARAALGAGDWATAYGLAAQCERAGGRSRGQSQVVQVIADSGVPAARDALAREIASLSRRAATDITRMSAAEGLGADQQLGMSFAMGWATRATAVLDWLRGAVVDADETELRMLAAVAADQRFALEVLGPDAEAIVRASPSRSSGPSAVTFASGYSTFLLGAARANMAYIESLGGTGRAPAAVSGPLLRLEAVANGITPDASTVSDEMRQLSTASVYFEDSGLLLTGGSVGLTLITSGQDPQVDPNQVSMLTNAIESGVAQTYELAANARERGASIELAVWRAQWSAAGYRASLDQPSLASMGAFALAQVNASVLNGAISAAAGGGAS